MRVVRRNSAEMEEVKAEQLDDVANVEAGEGGLRHFSRMATVENLKFGKKRSRQR